MTKSGGGGFANIRETDTRYIVHCICGSLKMPLNVHNWKYELDIIILKICKILGIAKTLKKEMLSCHRETGAMSLQQ